MKQDLIQKSLQESLFKNPMGFKIKEGFLDLEDLKTICFFVTQEQFKKISDGPRSFETRLSVLLSSLGSFDEMQALKDFLKKWSSKNRFFNTLALDSQLKSMDSSFLDGMYFLETLFEVIVEEDF